MDEKCTFGCHQHSETHHNQYLLMNSSPGPMCMLNRRVTKQHPVMSHTRQLFRKRSYSTQLPSVLSNERTKPTKSSQGQQVSQQNFVINNIKGIQQILYQDKYWICREDMGQLRLPTDARTFIHIDKGQELQKHLGTGSCLVTTFSTITPIPSNEGQAAYG